MNAHVVYCAYHGHIDRVDFHLVRPFHPSGRLTQLQLIVDLIVKKYFHKKEQAAETGMAQDPRVDGHHVHQVPMNTRVDLGAANHAPIPADKLKSGGNVRCGMPKCNTRTPIKCSVCNVALCPGACWSKWHKGE